MEVLNNVVQTISDIVWFPILVVALVGLGIISTIYLGAPQFVKFGAAWKQTFGGIFKKRDKGDAVQSMSSFQALATAIAAQVGTGNVAGVATAIISGGPGAIFWM